LLRVASPGKFATFRPASQVALEKLAGFVFVWCLRRRGDPAPYQPPSPATTLSIPSTQFPAMSQPSNKRILSGIQPSGVLHLGNYFGMMKPAIRWQDEGDAFYFIADYHALTTIQDAEKLREYSRGVALDFLACGLDPEKVTLFRQSDVPVVTELTWILMTVTPFGLLERGHSFKDKTARGIEASAGLFNYPALMAADILLYDSDVVPVGKDQKQHLEMTRDIAQRVNNRFDTEIFKLPDASIEENTATVPGTDGQKMSKSYGNTIEIFLPQKKMRKSIMKLKTDSTPVEEPKDPEGSLIIDLYKLVATPEEVEAMTADFRKGGNGYGHYKQELFEKIWEHFEPMRERREKILAEKNYVDDVLEAGANRAREVAGEIMDRVRTAVGLR
jgi:tryptophanyl-tRNA synthetase